MSRGQLFLVIWRQAKILHIFWTTLEDLDHSVPPAATARPAPAVNSLLPVKQRALDGYHKFSYRNHLF